MAVSVDLLAKIALAPILLVQALQVRNRALILPEAAGPRQASLGQGPDLRLLVLGDSAAAGVGADHQSQALSGQLAAELAGRFTIHWALNAATGATTRAATNTLMSEVTGQFDVAVISLGVNDLTHGVFLRNWQRQLHRLFSVLTDQHGVKLILMSGLPPMGNFPLLPQPLRWVMGRQSRRFDAALASLTAAHPRAVHVPLDLPFDASMMAADGFHPSPPAYHHWALMLKDQILAHRDRLS